MTLFLHTVKERHFIFFVVDIPDYDFNIAEACHIEIKHTLPLQSNYKVITKFSPPPYVGK